MLNSICCINHYCLKILWKSYQYLLVISFTGIPHSFLKYFVCAGASNYAPECNWNFVAGGYYLCCSTALTNLRCLHFLILSIQGKKMS